MSEDEGIGSAADLHAAATALTGLADFGADDYHDGLAVLLESYARNAALTAKGIRVARALIRGALTARLFSEAGWARYPDCAGAGVERPIFVIGLPRTGTTALHRLLTADPAHQGLEAWLAEMPQPRPPRETWAGNPVFQHIQAGFARHHVAHPEFMAVHYMAADQVEECWQLLRQSMRSISFECLAHVPGYSSWLRVQDWTGAYRSHRRNLQLIGLPDCGRRWVLKNPSHLFALDALLQVYPDALVIQTHRDPRTAIASVSSLAAQATAGWSTEFRGEVIGRDQLETWASGLEEFNRARARHDPARLCDIEYSDFVANPVGTVESVYRRFGLTLSGRAADAVRARLSRAPGAPGRPTSTRCPISGSPASRSMSASRVITVPAPDRAAPGRGPAPGHQAGGPGTWIRAKLPRRATDMLPRGTLTVGSGLLVLGLGYYAHLAIAGHSLPASGMAALSVLWSIVFLLGLGVFLPIEQELIRHVAARAAAGEGIAPAVRRACALSGVVLAVILVPLAAAAGPVAGRLFGGDTAMVTVLGCACAALAVTAVSRGTLAGLGAFGGYGAQLAIDGGLRAAMAGALGLAGSRSAVAFGLILTVAPVLAVLLTLGPLIPRLRPGPPLPWAAMSHRLAQLIGTMLLAQVIINAPVISVRLLSPGSPAVVGALLAAAVMARVPLFVFTSLQTSLLPGLADAVAAGDRARFRQLLARSCAVVVVLGVACGLPATILGPWLTQVLFGTQPVLGHAAFGWLAFGTLCYMLAMVVGQGAMALSRHRDQLLSWMAGVVVLALVTAAPGEVTMRVVTAYAAGCATVAVVLAIVLTRHAAAAWRHASGRAHAWPTPNH